MTPVYVKKSLNLIHYHLELQTQQFVKHIKRSHSKRKQLYLVIKSKTQTTPPPLSLATDKFAKIIRSDKRIRHHLGIVLGKVTDGKQANPRP